MADPRASTQPLAFWRDPVLLATVAGGFALRAGLLARYPHIPGLGDEIRHYAMARFVELFGSGAIGLWAPLYDVGLAAVFLVAGPDPVGPKAVQVVISTATLIGVYVLARDAGGLRAGRIAAALCAVDPTLVAFTHYLYSETLFIALLVTAVALLFRAPERRSRAQLIAAGLAFGLATLTRSVGFYFLVLWIGFALLRRQFGEARQFAIVLAVTLAVVLPWTARNAVKYHDFMLVDGTLGRTAYLAFSERLFNYDLGFATLARQSPERDECREGLAPGAPELPDDATLLARVAPERFGLTPSAEAARVAIYRARRFAVEDLAAIQRCELRNALAFAAAHPATVTEHVLRRVYAFWGPNSYLLRGVAGGVYPDGPLARDHYPFWKASVLLLQALALAGALLAYGGRITPLLGFLAAFIAYYTAIHVFAVAYSRYRLPLMPFLYVASALWLARPAWPESRARGALVGAAGLGFAAIFFHYTASVLP